jgi:hypothetical protein
VSERFRIRIDRPDGSVSYSMTLLDEQKEWVGSRDAAEYYAAAQNGIWRREGFKYTVEPVPEEGQK